MEKYMFEQSSNVVNLIAPWYETKVNKKFILYKLSLFSIVNFYRFGRFGEFCFMTNIIFGKKSFT